MSDLDSLLEDLRAAGSHDSTGHFTLDLRHAREKLARFQLGGPTHYVLRLLASAVAQGADRFEVVRSGHVLKASWSGPGFSRDELARLFEALLGSGSTDLALRELASGLNTARTLFPRIVLRSREVVLRLDDNDVRLEAADSRAGVSVELSGQRVSLVTRLLGLAYERELLQNFGSLAPLALQRRKLPALEFDLRPLRLIQFGAPPLACAGKVDVVHESPGNGSGYLSLDGGRAGFATVVHLGVRFYVPWKLPGQLTWWTGELPLNLSRTALVQGEKLAAWQAELLPLIAREALHLVRERVGDTELPEVVQWFLEHDLPGLEELALFRRTNGESATLTELRAQYRRQGYLGVSALRWSSPWGGWEPGEFVHLSSGMREALARACPNLVQVDTLQRQRRALRLPEGGTYLVRLPNVPRPGEVGLRASLPDGVFRHWRKGWKVSELLPSGIDVAARSHRVDALLPAVYLALAEAELSPEQQPLRTWHLLEYLWAMCYEFPTPRLDSLRSKRYDRLPWLGKQAPSDWVQRLLQAVRPGGVPLSQLEGKRPFVAVGQPRPGDPRPLLHVPNFRSFVALRALLQPPARVRYALPLTSALFEIVAALPGTFSALDLLRAFTGAECAAGRYLSRLKLDLPASSQPDGPALLSACQAAYCSRRRMGTLDVVAALRAFSPEAAAVLERAGAGPPPNELTDLEQQADLGAELEASTPTTRPFLLWERGWLHYSCQRFDQARSDVSLAASLEPRSTMIAVLQASLADAAEAWALHRRLGATDPTSLEAHVGAAHDCLRNGLVQPALNRCLKALELDPMCGEALVLFARIRLISDPDESLRLCEQAQHCDDCPGSLWEVRAAAYEALGQVEPEVACAQRFLAVWPHTLLEPEVLARRASARRHLDKLT